MIQHFISRFFTMLFSDRNISGMGFPNPDWWFTKHYIN